MFLHIRGCWKILEEELNEYNPFFDFDSVDIFREDT